MKPHITIRDGHHVVDVSMAPIKIEKYEFIGEFTREEWRVMNENK